LNRYEKHGTTTDYYAAVAGKLTIVYKVDFSYQ
jgi:hypothetical protein